MPLLCRGQNCLDNCVTSANGLSCFLDFLAGEVRGEDQSHAMKDGSRHLWLIYGLSMVNLWLIYG